MNFFLIQLIGAIAFILLSASYYKKDKKSILFMQILAYAVFAVHYYLLSGVTGTICNIMGLISMSIIYIFEKNNMKNKKGLIICLIPFLILISLTTYENIFSIFPIIAAVVSIISFLNNSENVIRLVGVLSAVCWLIYAIVYKSYISIVFEALTLIATFIAFYKNRRSKNNREIST